MTDTRFPRHVFRNGDEPDPRFSLANERTFLAWLRTALALFAAAFALETLELPAPATWRLPAAAVFVVLGIVAAVQAWTGWAATERALRRNQPLPGIPVGGVLVVGIIAGVALVVIGMSVEAHPTRPATRVCGRNARCSRGAERVSRSASRASSRCGSPPGRSASPPSSAA